MLIAQLEAFDSFTVAPPEAKEAKPAGPTTEPVPVCALCSWEYRTSTPR
jgi:hypothetical protein